VLVHAIDDLDLASAMLFLALDTEGPAALALALKDAVKGSPGEAPQGG
jgi:hypothetical protein